MIASVDSVNVEEEGASPTLDIDGCSGARPDSRGVIPFPYLLIETR
jgi:hypothetical protein